MPNNKGFCKRFTPEEDARLMELAKESKMALAIQELGRIREILNGRIKRLESKGIYHPKNRVKRKWSEEEIHELERLIKHHTLKEAAAMLGRTAYGCQGHLDTNGKGQVIPRQVTRDDMTVAEVAKALGMNPRHTQDRVKEGVIPSKRVGRNGGYYRVSKAEIYRLIRENHDYFMPELMEEPFRSYCLRYQTIGVQYVSLRTAARLKGCHPRTMHEVIKDGRLPAIHRPLFSSKEWWIKEEDLELWNVRREKQNCANARIYQKPSSRKPSESFEKAT